MTSSVSVLLLFAFILPNILETNCNIQYKSNGLCDFGCEIKLVSDKSRFSRSQIFDGNFKAVHLDFHGKQMEESSPAFLFLHKTLNILQPFWVKEEYSDELLRILRSVEFEKHSFKSSKTVFPTNVRLLDMLKSGCNLMQRDTACLIRDVSYSLVRDMTGGNGFICYSAFVKGSLQNICCDQTTGNSVECKEQPSVSHLWLDVLSLAEPYLVVIMAFLLTGVMMIPYLPYTEDDLSASEEGDKMVEPDQDVNPITKYIKRQFVGKLVGNSISKAYGHTAIVFIFKTFLFIGTLYVLIFCEIFHFEQINRKHFILALLQLPVKFSTKPFHIFFVVWFCFKMLLFPLLLYITCCSSWVLFPWIDQFSKGVKKSIVQVMLELYEVFTTFFDIFLDIVVWKTKVLNTEAGLLYLLEFPFFLTPLVWYCCIRILVHFLLIIELVLPNNLSTLRLAGPILANRTDDCFSFVQTASRLLQSLSYIVLYFCMYFFFFPTSLVLVSILRYSLVGLHVNHSMLLPYMTFYGVVAYFMFRVYSSYVSGYVELRELVVDTCIKIVEKNGDDHRFRQVISHHKGVIRISEKLLEHIYSEMKPLKKNCLRNFG